MEGEEKREGKGRAIKTPLLNGLATGLYVVKSKNGIGPGLFDVALKNLGF